MSNFLHRIISADSGAWRQLIWGGATVTMLIPVGLQLTSEEMRWSGADFVVFGAMLLISAFAFEMIVRFAGASVWSRLGAGLAISGALLMALANLAVGIIGNESNPINLLFFALLLAGALGAIAVRFHADGLARVMLWLAAGQALLGVGLAATGLGFTPALTAVYVALWLGAGALFRKGANRQPQRAA